MSAEGDSGREAGFWSRERTLALSLFLLTVASVFVCYLLVRPFISALAWALALAVVAYPVYPSVARRIRHPGWAAGVAVLLVAVMVVGPAIFVVRHIVVEAAAGVEKLQPNFTPEGWRTISKRHPRIARTLERLAEQVDIGQAIERAAAAISAGAVTFVSGSVRGLVDLLIIFFVLFYLFRDARPAIAAVRRLLPLSGKEADHVLEQIKGTIYATVVGTIVIAAVQGTLGGLMFWWLGLPGPVLWGMVMGLLAIVPVLGAFVVWIPAAVFLALQGDWIKAIILTGWGALVIGLIDNVLYPVLVGKKLHLHTLPVFFAIVGGIIFFGAAGIIIGPVVLAFTVALMDVWRRRTGGGHTIEEALSKDQTTMIRRTES
ncbi:MAG: AI-2E family transporter [Verrucomicrobia subdivision 3 bacterium]|nr:AI-2E family transporter [Limisphaerales bacterium]